MSGLVRGLPQGKDRRPEPRGSEPLRQGAVLVPPLDPCQGGQLDLGGGAPWAAGADQLGLVQPIDCFRDGVAVADSSSPLPAAATVPADAGYAATGSSAGWRGSLIS